MLRHTEIPGHGPGDFAGHIGPNYPAAARETVEDADCSAEWPVSVQLTRHGWRPLYNIGRFRLHIVPWSACHPHRAAPRLWPNIWQKREMHQYHSVA